jgi:hypothetical protein
MGRQSRKACDNIKCDFYNKGFHNHFNGRPPLFEAIRKELYKEGELSTPELYDKFKKKVTSVNSLINYLAHDAYIGNVGKTRVKAQKSYGTYEVAVWRHRFTPKSLEELVQ